MQTEKGSITLLGVWLLGMFLSISTLLFVLSSKESKVIYLAHKNYEMQMLAESLLANQVVELQHDKVLVAELMSRTEMRLKKLKQGEQGEIAYFINAQRRADNLIIAVILNSTKADKPENVFALQWGLAVDSDTLDVEVEGIG